jgi:hypothetical protein
MSPAGRKNVVQWKLGVAGDEIGLVDHALWIDMLLSIETDL